MATDLYRVQNDIYQKTRSENIDFLERLRALTDQYDEIMMEGEVGEMGHRSIKIMGEYTRGRTHLQMAYSFAMLGPDFNAEHFRNRISGFQSCATDGHPYWSFSNHDVPRQVSRWAEYVISEDSIVRSTCSMLMSFEGMIGICQGKELGQTETELVFEELTDPPAIRYWPAVKGRNGCLRPIVCEKDAPNAGFSSASPWLPVKAPQAANAVDQQSDAGTLTYHKKMIACRKNSPALAHGTTTFISLTGPLLAMIRADSEQRLICIFNLPAKPQTVSLKSTVKIVKGNSASVSGETLTLNGNGYAYLIHGNIVPLLPV